jgi:DNA polymerase III delta subunit
MIYLLYGSDGRKSRAKMHELRDTLAAKRPDAALVAFDDDTFDSAQLDELAVSFGLFTARSIVILDKVFGSREAKTAVLERIAELADSENIFIILEGTLDKASFAKLEKRAEKVQEFSLPDIPKKKESTFFTLADALGKKDKKELWVLYRRAIDLGTAPEELHGILFWQVKSMLLAKEAKDAAAAGINPFVFKKAAGFAKHFSLPELRKLSSDLVRMYHDSHRGLSDFEASLEVYILNL